MKNLFFKSLLIAAMLFATANSWAECYVYESDTEYTILLNQTTEAITIPDGGIRGVLSYKYKIGASKWGIGMDALFSHYATAQWSEDGNDWNELIKASTKSRAYGNPISADLPKEAKYIRFHASADKGGSRDVYVTEVKIEGASYADAPNMSIWEPSAVIGSIASSTTATMAWSNIPELEATLSGEGASQFEYSIENNAHEECGEYGEAIILLTYKHDMIGTHEATLNIAAKDTTYVIELIGTTIQGEQTITWEQDLSYIKADDHITLNAEAKTNITYASSDTSIVSIAGNQLVIKATGQAIITAIAEQTAEYASATAEKVITISKATPIIAILPTVESITYGSTFEDAEFIDATVNTEGTWQWNDSRTTEVLNAGTYTFNIQFIPNDTNCYNGIDTTVVVVISKAPQTIEWDIDQTSMYVGDQLEFRAISSSGLSVGYEVSDNENGIVLLDGNVLIGMRTGIVVVTAYQDGDDNYLAADPITYNISVNTYTTTAIDELHTPQSTAQKILRNGVVYIIRDNKTYSITGQEIK